MEAKAEIVHFLSQPQRNPPMSPGFALFTNLNRKQYSQRIFIQDIDISKWSNTSRYQHDYYPKSCCDGCASACPL